MRERVFGMSIVTARAFSFVASLAISGLLAACGAIASTPHSSNERNASRCSKPEELGGRPGGIRYRAFPNKNSSELWMMFPCGQTAKHEEFNSGIVDPVMACTERQEWYCFENRLPDTDRYPLRSDVFIAIPKSYGGGTASWTKEGVDFVATPISNRGDDDLSVIVAQRTQDSSLAPARQEFVFSVTHGILAITVFDDRVPATQVYILAQRTGLFARSLAE